MLCFGMARHTAVSFRVFHTFLPSCYALPLYFDDVFRVNIDLGPAQDKMLITGLHSICDVHCTQCRAYLGWKYVCQVL